VIGGNTLLFVVGILSGNVLGKIRGDCGFKKGVGNIKDGKTAGVLNILLLKLKELFL